MRPTLPVIVGLVSAVLVSLSAAPLAAQPTPELPSLSHGQLEQLDRGYIFTDLVDGEVPIGDVVGVVEARSERVVDMLMACDRHADYIEHLLESETVIVSGDHMVCRGVTDTPWPLHDRTWAVRQSFTQTMVDGYEVWVGTWEYVPGSGNLIDGSGYWLIAPWGPDGQHALVRYHIEVELGEALARPVQRWAINSMLPDRIRALREAARREPDV